MDAFIASTDNTKIHFTLSGNGHTTLMFVHGWLGNGHWWDAQEKFFSAKHRVVTIDLGGHGNSGKNRRKWSAQQYADDIHAVIKQIDAGQIILVGHSMAGAYALEAALLDSAVKAVVLVDTLKNMDQLMTIQQAEERLFQFYRRNFKDAVENLLPKFLFCESTPQHIRERLQKEFLENDGDFAVTSIEPLYKMDIREVAKRITVPVRGIYSTFTPSNRKNNRKYFRDFDLVSIQDSGHYPMLEKPEAFNEQLRAVLHDLGL